MTAYPWIRGCLLALAFSQAFAAGAAEKSSPLLVFANAPAQSVQRLSDLPAAIQGLLQARVPGGIAAAGSPYNATDVVADESLPSRRLRGAGRTGPLWFVWYEHGGRGYHQHLVLFRSEGSSAEVVASAILLREPRDVAALQLLAKTGALAPGLEPEPAHW